MSRDRASALADAMSLARHAASAVGAASAGEGFNENPSPFRGGTCAWESQFFSRPCGTRSVCRRLPGTLPPQRARCGALGTLVSCRANLGRRPAA